MHLNPAKGSPIDVPSRIIETFYTSGNDARIPIFTFNKLNRGELRRILDFILNLDLTLNPGGACHQAVFMRRDEIPLMPDYNSNIRNLLRSPKLDVMVAESPEAVYNDEGLYYSGSNLIVLQEPSDVERTLALSVLDGGVVMIREGLEVVIKRGEQVQTQTLTMADEFTSLYLREIKNLCER
jgi:cyanophycin synthetase